MTSAHSRSPANFLVRLIALSLGVSAFFADTGPALAFCIENRTQTRLLFTARLEGEAEKGFVLRQWVDGGARVCGAPESGPGILEVFVFADEDSIEGCDDRIVADGTLRLMVFSEYDNCAWRTSR